ncbi:leucine zipper domain-containing protein [Streptomyces massasporeus]|uniref:leucine zipper domain-containing protein n=1 Tax=Streptomyces massasporeus TaxID=67324 RepID=UPI003F4CD939
MRIARTQEALVPCRPADADRQTASARCAVDDDWPVRGPRNASRSGHTTEARWAGRYRQPGATGTHDRSSRPHRGRTAGRPAAPRAPDRACTQQGFDHMGGERSDQSQFACDRCGATSAAVRERSPGARTPSPSGRSDHRGVHHPGAGRRDQTGLRADRPRAGHRPSATPSPPWLGRAGRRQRIRAARRAS